VLFNLLQALVDSRPEGTNYTVSDASEATLTANNDATKIVIDELTQIIDMPAYRDNAKPSSVAMDYAIRDQLRDFVLTIAGTYRDVPFHNFEHASHVIMSSEKLMKRIVNPDAINYDQDPAVVSKQIFDLTYGISQDPLLHFAVVFSALIHDVDHTGLTNAELIKDGRQVAEVYRSKSVAEQNSVDMAWGILMDERFKELRSCIYTSDVELRRFRQLVVNAVMATDIADKDLKQLREQRWDAAFSEGENAVEQNNLTALNRKATIIFEYIIQASDISHTMQHWHTYQKFNARLFEERYVAWMNGHLGKNPAEGWFGGELWFFDNYIIPLAQKLNKCGVFGVSYQESLTYALENRREWEIKGKKIVELLFSHCQAKYSEVEDPSESLFELTEEQRLMSRRQLL